jgi:hypothetical protein
VTDQHRTGQAEPTAPPQAPEGAPRRGLTVHPALLERLERDGRALAADAPAGRFVPRDARAAGAVALVDSPGRASALLDDANTLRLVCVGIDFAHRHNRPGVVVRRTGDGERTWHDPRAIVPLLLGLALAEDLGDGRTRLRRYAVDFRPAGVAAALAPVFRLPVAFAAHQARAALFCLWQAGLAAPDRLWDTRVAERAFSLGLHHPRYMGRLPRGEAEEAAAREEAEAHAEQRLGLTGVCLRRGVDYAFGGGRRR